MNNSDSTSVSATHTESESSQTSVRVTAPMLGTITSLKNGEILMAITNDNNSIPNDKETNNEELAVQEEIYLEETEEEVRAILISDDPSQHNPTAECWERKREQLEIGWRTEIDDRRK